MSLGVVFRGPEGIVLAADSRVTLLTATGAQVIAQAYYDNATKLLRIKSQPFVGMITVGLSAIGVTTPRTPSSFLPEFEKQLPSDGTRLPIKDFAAKLGQFFLEQWHSSMPPDGDFQDMIFFVAGYDETDVYGKAYRVDIPNRPDPVEILHDFGLQSEGQTGIIQRILNGLDLAIMPKVLEKCKITSDDESVRLFLELRAISQLKIPYQFISLQDAVDLCLLLEEVTVQLMKYTTDVRGVGGPIDVATITRVEGFNYVQHKEIHGERVSR